MKHTFAKKALLLGAISMLLSAVPIHAMNVDGAPMDPALQQEVATKAGFFSKWTREALRKKLDEDMKFLDAKFKSLMKCLKGEGCTRAQIAVVTGTLATILAIITVLTYGVLYKKGIVTGIARRPGEFVGQIPSRISPYMTKAGGYAKEYVTGPLGRRLAPAGETVSGWASAAGAKARAAGTAIRSRLPRFGSTSSEQPLPAQSLESPEPIGE